MRGHPTQRQRTLLAYEVYQEVLDTAGWLRNWMRSPLESFDLTVQGFRLLMLLDRRGPMRTVELAKRLRFRRQNLDAVFRRLEERGWVVWRVVTLPAATDRPKRKREKKIGRKRRDWKIGVVGLTPRGTKFLRRAFPSHAKVLKGLMRALHVREQRTLIEICRKLRAGAILKFMSEISLAEEWEQAGHEEVDDVDLEAEDARGNLLPREASEADGGELQEGLGKRATLSMDRLNAEDRKRIDGIVGKMRKYDVLKAAGQVDWNRPKDEEREASNAMKMLIRILNGRERELLERLAEGRSDREVIEVLKGACDE